MIRFHKGWHHIKPCEEHSTFSPSASEVMGKYVTLLWLVVTHLMKMCLCVMEITYKSNNINCINHWGRVMHICIGNLTIIGSNIGLSPGLHQAIIWTNAGILLTEPLGTNFSEILNEIVTMSFKKMFLKVLSAKWKPLCPGLNVITRFFKKNRHISSNVYWGIFISIIEILSRTWVF